MALNPKPQSAEQQKLRKIVGELGFVGGASSLCVVLLNLFNVDSFVIALTTILLSMILLVLLHRKMVAKHVNGAFAIIVMMVLISLLLYMHKFKAGDNSVITDTTSVEFRQELYSLVEKSREEVVFVGANFYVTAGNLYFHELVKRKISEGVNFKFLFLNPDSPALEHIAKNFNIDKQQMKPGQMITLEGLKQIEREINTSLKHQVKQGTFEYRMFDEVPQNRCYLFDIESEHGVAIMVPYGNSVNSTKLPAFRFNKSNQAYFDPFYAGINRLWLSSK